jgi:O-methyltransferase
MSNFAEVGVWKGFGAVKVQQRMHQGDVLYLFDSFQGHREPCGFDNRVAHPKGRYSDTSVEAIRAKFPNAIIVAGYVPESFAGHEHLVFKFARIDVDHYLPTKAASEFFKSRMEPDGIIEFDDYRHPDCPGATLAIDEVFGRESITGPPYQWRMEK